MSDPFFAGKNGFIWWFGRVEDNSDPLSMGRCRVRIDGWHNQDINEIPTIALPWAQVATPITNAAVGGIGQSAIGPQPGTRVWGFFIDGKTGQIPMILATIPGVSVNERTYPIPEGSTPSQPLMDKLFGFSPFSKETDTPQGYNEESSNVNSPIPEERKLLNISKSEWTVPFTGFISSAYGPRGGRFHCGVDICPAGYYQQTDAGAPHLNGMLRGKTGLPVYAAADGEVVYKFTSDKGQRGSPTTYDKNKNGSRSFGNAVVIRHKLSTGTYTTVYAHLGVSQDPSKDAPGAGILVNVGDKVKKGQQIATVGRSHCWDSPTHLHFEIRLGTGLPAAKNHINPGKIFPQMYAVHRTQLNWLNSQTKYNVKPIYSLNDAPVIGGNGPEV